MYFSYDHLEFKYEPFPIGLARPLMDETTYKELVDNYPSIEHFKFMPKLGKKYTLSERFNKPVYEEVIRNNPVWREFHRWLKSDEFVMGVLQALRDRHIDLGYDPSLSPIKRVAKLIKDIKGGDISPRSARLKSRFEFSMLPADGGNIKPHTDSSTKIITLVVSMLDENEWNPGFGGGTDVNRPRDITRIFNELNAQGEFEDMEVLDSFEFTPNQAVIFIRTFNSWHSVRPMTGAGSPTMRKTLTINIERHL